MFENVVQVCCDTSTGTPSHLRQKYFEICRFCGHSSEMKMNDGFFPLQNCMAMISRSAKTPRPPSSPTGSMDGHSSAVRIWRDLECNVRFCPVKSYHRQIPRSLARESAYHIATVRFILVMVVFVRCSLFLLLLLWSYRYS
jgi:hypothetical protein